MMVVGILGHAALAAWSRSGDFRPLQRVSKRVLLLGAIVKLCRRDGIGRLSWNTPWNHQEADTRFRAMM